MLSLVLTLFSFSIDSRAQLPDTLRWYFEANRIAVDAYDLYRDLASAGYDSTFFMSSICDVSIVGHADCNAFEIQNELLAAHRKDYLVNYFESRSYAKNLRLQTATNAAPECINADANPQWRRVDFILLKFEAINPEVEHKEPKLGVATNKKLEAITELNVGETLVLDGLNFYPGRHIPLNEAKPVLKKLLKIMADHPTLEIEIQGHICCGPKSSADGVDMDTNEPNLSWSRAEIIYDYLIENGIAKDRLSFKGFAMTKPLVWPEVTILDQNKNRRVEVMVTTK